MSTEGWRLSFLLPGGRRRYVEAKARQEARGWFHYEGPDEARRMTKVCEYGYHERCDGWGRTTLPHVRGERIVDGPPVHCDCACHEGQPVPEVPRWMR